MRSLVCYYINEKFTLQKYSFFFLQDNFEILNRSVKVKKKGCPLTGKPFQTESHETYFSLLSKCF